MRQEMVKLLIIDETDLIAPSYERVVLIKERFEFRIQDLLYQSSCLCKTSDYVMFKLSDKFMINYGYNVPIQIIKIKHQ